MTQGLSLRYATTADMPALEPLWSALYEHQREHGMRLPVEPGAFSAWEKSITPQLNRFASVALAERDEGLIGFVAGRVRALPAYFGGGMTGFISEVYVSTSHRGSGAGEQLLKFALDWFAAQGIDRVELQVVTGNPDAVRFYKRLGWSEELVQLVWENPRRA